MLAVREAETLAELEQVIERGLTTFVDVGNALLSIRDDRLYRADYATFEDYCRDRWGMTRQHAYRMIDAAQVVSPMGDSGLSMPTSERQARELARVPEERRAEVWQQTIDATGGKPTAAAVREMAERSTVAQMAAERGDRWGYREGEAPDGDPLPEPIAEQIERRIEAKAAPVETWSPDEVALREVAEAGETVVVTVRGTHDRLIAWAEQRGLYVRVDRRSEWGNPFEMPADGDRAAVVANYEQHYLPHKPSLLAKLDTLRGKVLGCWCAPEMCHGDVLAKWAEGRGEQC